VRISRRWRVASSSVPSTIGGAASLSARDLEDIALLQAGLVEDYAIGESIQVGFAAGANPYFHFGLFEGTLAHFHRSLDAAFAAP
jgi:hypothetical protein